ncbi:putative NADH dehydrogenase ubiquinone 1 alpha subcomplex [Clavispora lusitaniae]|uniref:NADH dehydrogenase ubiquinone 1 alpha subcomplex n=2 Tax=Clavispora lusitaniae TaxID=36911 RepID=A0ACD0WSI4_CLALS|nr:GRIM-19 family protein [Clavispora lusitaniae]OVF05454.1 putative mitochondrial distribution and morphology protein [Clavispora lusitaniae]QFZ30098.1 putative NADH dehydrogenase ubiquinone 1 alpha subcomplex [Clavispora lusitaniae]QFZ35762.1 putative NADH dehydrogenase ubiquinone 1 alpha subcomplex [Clavispora lusitaniae]QFZ41444.1 putative NADH dehydrogenase ubiquinone 1 alpha subcomplex [Clavispora lusitaniae]
MQDLPPIGGYEPVQWKRNLPSRGFRPLIYFWGISGIISFGFYKFYQGVDEQRELLRERQWARFYLEPLLRAEEDRHLARRYFSEMKRQEMVAESMSPETRSKFEEPIYNDKSKLRFPKYTAGVDPSQQ